MNDEQYLQQLEDDMYDRVDENFEQVEPKENYNKVNTNRPFYGKRGSMYKPKY